MCCHFKLFINYILYIFNLIQNISISNIYSISLFHSSQKMLRSIKLTKNICLNNIFFFASSKTKQILGYLHEQINKKQISNQINYNKILQLINEDINAKTDRYELYKQVKQIFQAYLKQVGNEEKINKYNPQIINEEGIKISELMHRISEYPKFQLQKQNIRFAYQIFCRHLHRHSDKQLNKALLFVLKVDSRAEQSVIYNQFLKFYLGEKWETIKAKYQLNLKSQSFGNFIKKMIASITHRGFLRRTPDYDKSIDLLYPSQVLNALIQNSSTSESLMIRKAIYQKIFTPISDKYQRQMKSNLYHQKNIQLWQELNKNCNIIFHKNKLIQKQCIYLRQLYITLFLVLRQQKKLQNLYDNLSQTIYAYVYMKQNYNGSNKVKQFQQSLNEFIKKQIIGNQQNTTKLLQNIHLNKFSFVLCKQFSELYPLIINKISKQVSPLTFSVYFNDFLHIIQKWTPQFVSKLVTAVQNNYFDNISIQNSLNFLNELKKLKMEGKISNMTQQNNSLLYNRILQSIIHRDYKKQPEIKQIITIFNIYAFSSQFKNSSEVNNLQILRVFLFRFISDNKSKATTKQLQNILQILLKLNDERLFGDGEGNYQKNIYEQMWQVVQNSFIDSQLKAKIREKIKISEQDISKSSQIKQILSKIIK